MLRQRSRSYIFAYFVEILTFGWNPTKRQLTFSLTLRAKRVICVALFIFQHGNVGCGRALSSTPVRSQTSTKNSRAFHCSRSAFISTIMDRTFLFRWTPGNIYKSNFLFPNNAGFVRIQMSKDFLSIFVLIVIVGKFLDLLKVSILKDFGGSNACGFSA